MTAVFVSDAPCGFLAGMSGGTIWVTSLGGNLPASNHPLTVSLRLHPARPRPAEVASATSATRVEARIDPPVFGGLLDHTKVSTSFISLDSVGRIAPPPSGDPWACCDGPDQAPARQRHHQWRRTAAQPQYVVDPTRYIPLALIKKTV